MRQIMLAAVTLGAALLSGCITLPQDAATAIGPHQPDANAAYGQAESGQFQ